MLEKLITEKPQILVSAAIVDDGWILLTKHGAYWHLPDGQLGCGETALAALKRSLSEDLRISTDEIMSESLQPFYVSETVRTGSGHHYVTLHYRISLRNPNEIAPREGLKIEWVPPPSAHDRDTLESTRSALIALGYLPE